MEQVIGNIARFLIQGISLIVQFLQAVWQWSFGAIIDIFRSDFQSYRTWEQVVLVIAILGIAYCIYLAGKQIWEAVVSLFKSFVSLLSAFVTALPWILIAGIVAAAAGYVIKTQ